MTPAETMSPALAAAPQLEWRVNDVAGLFPAAARLPVVAARAARGEATPGDHIAHARTLYDLGRGEEARLALIPALAATDTVQAHLLAGMIARQTGRRDEAASHFQAVLKRQPDHVAARIGSARSAASRSAALDILREGMARGAGDPDLWMAFTDIAIAGERVSALRDALSAFPPPARYVACVDDARVYLAEAEGDRPTLDRYLQDPALVWRGTLAEADDPLLQAVLAEVKAAPDYIPDPYDKSTRGGMQAPFLPNRDRPAWKALFRRLQPLVEDHLARLRQAGPPFPVPDGAVGFRSWAVRLSAGGRQAAHLHGSSWVSGVFYLSVSGHASDGDGEAGALRMPLLPRGRLADWPVRSIPAAVGKLVLFPSYMRHDTVPAAGAGERVCIAFDLVSLP